MVWFAPSLVSSQNYVQEQNGELTSSSVRTHRTNSLEWYTVLNTPENKRNEIHPFMEVLAFLDFSKEENKLTHQEQIYFSAMLPPGSYFLTVQNHDVLAGPALLLELRITNKNNETESVCFFFVIVYTDRPVAGLVLSQVLVPLDLSWSF